MQIPMKHLHKGDIAFLLQKQAVENVKIQSSLNHLFFVQKPNQN